MGKLLGYIIATLATATILGVIFTLFVPYLDGSRRADKAREELELAGRIRLAIVRLSLDAFNESNKTYGYPYNLGITTTKELKDRLVAGHYLTEDDIVKLHFDTFIYGNVGSSDPEDTILVRSNPETERYYQLVVLKDGSSSISRPGQPIVGKIPPRAPSYLAP